MVHVSDVYFQYYCPRTDLGTCSHAHFTLVHICHCLTRGPGREQLFACLPGCALCLVACSYTQLVSLFQHFTVLRACATMVNRQHRLVYSYISLYICHISIPTRLLRCSSSVIRASSLDRRHLHLQQQKPSPLPCFFSEISTSGYPGFT
jgi:hypothetical protein